jgi:hypothetical protein
MATPYLQETQHATFSNRDRCAINTALFSELVKTEADKAVIVFSDNVEMFGADKKKYERQHQIFRDNKLACRSHAKTLLGLSSHGVR